MVQLRNLLAQAAVRGASFMSMRRQNLFRQIRFISTATLPNAFSIALLAPPNADFAASPAVFRFFPSAEGSQATSVEPTVVSYGLPVMVRAHYSGSNMTNDEKLNRCAALIQAQSDLDPEAGVFIRSVAMEQMTGRQPASMLAGAFLQTLERFDRAIAFEATDVEDHRDACLAAFSRLRSAAPSAAG